MSHHCREKHGFTELLRLLSYNTDGSYGSFSLMDCGKKTCDSDRKTSHKDHKTGFQGNISNTAAQDTNLGKCKECYQQSVNTLRTGKKLKKQNLSKFVRVFCYNACCCTAAVPTPMAEPIPARATEIAAPNNAQTIPLIILILLNIYIFCIFAEWVELFSSALKEFTEKLYVL